MFGRKGNAMIVKIVDLRAADLWSIRRATNGARWLQGWWLWWRKAQPHGPEWPIMAAIGHVFSRPKPHLQRMLRGQTVSMVDGKTPQVAYLTSAARARVGGNEGLASPPLFPQRSKDA